MARRKAVTPHMAPRGGPQTIPPDLNPYPPEPSPSPPAPPPAAEATPATQTPAPTASPEPAPGTDPAATGSGGAADPEAARAAAAAAVEQSMGAARAAVAAAQAAAIAIQDAADALRNTHNLATIAAGVAMSRFLATGDARCLEALPHDRALVDKAIEEFAAIAAASAQMVKHFPSGSSPDDAGDRRG